MKEVIPVKKGYYAVILTCSNCGHEFVKQYLKGKEVPVLEECPACGCLTAWHRAT